MVFCFIVVQPCFLMKIKKYFRMSATTLNGTLKVDLVHMQVILCKYLLTEKKVVL